MAILKIGSVCKDVFLDFVDSLSNYFGVVNSFGFSILGFFYQSLFYVFFNYFFFSFATVSTRATRSSFLLSSSIKFAPTLLFFLSFESEHVYFNTVHFVSDRVASSRKKCFSLRISADQCEELVTRNNYPKRHLEQ